MSKNPYVEQVKAILGPLYDHRHDRLDTVTWNTVQEAKQLLIVFRQMKTNIGLVRKQVAANKKVVAAKYSNKKAQVMSPGTQIFFGKKAAGHSNAMKKHHLDQQKQHDLHPFEQAEHFIAAVLAGIDGLKTQVDLWLTQHPK